MVLIIARCLPHIVPNVLLNKREVFIYLFIVVVVVVVVAVVVVVVVIDHWGTPRSPPGSLSDVNPN